MAFLGQEGKQVVGGNPGQRITRVEGQLEGRRPHVGQQHVQVGRVQAGFFGSGIEQVFRVGCHELVDRPGAGDQDGGRGFQPSPRPAHLLPGRGDGARVAGQDRCVQAADVDAQLQRVGRHHAEHFTRPQPGLDLAPLGGQVAAAVSADALVRPKSFAQ